jgi:HAD superfamily hydrolase (TIGR01509 family)
MTRAVFFDVDFTLIYPGPTFQGEGYQQFCERHGLSVDPSRFEGAVADASSLLDEASDHVHDAQLFIKYIGHIIRRIGGCGAGVDECAAEIYREWAVNNHFSLYDDVAPVLNELAATGLRLGLISNTHRCLASFQNHFELDGLITGAISSSEHGFMKPHPSIFLTGLRLLRVSPEEAVMVGDNIRQDIEGALAVGMRAVLLCRGEGCDGAGRRLHRTVGAAKVAVIGSLRELPALLEEGW